VRVGLVIYGSLETVTGGFLYDRRLVEYLRACGDAVEIFSIPWRTYGRHLLDNVSRGIRRSLAEARLDVLLQDELNHPSLFHINSLLRQARYPIVSIVHHLRCSELRPSWQNRLYAMIERRYLLTVDGFVFNSHTTGATVGALIGQEKPSVVAYPGRDGGEANLSPEHVRDRAWQPGPLRLLMVGNLIPRKNLHTLLSALAQLPGDDWQLEVVGSLDTDAEYVRHVKAQIQDLDLSDRVSLLGTLTGEQLAVRYAESQLLAAPSSYEGFGLVYLEGKSYGVPALASTTGAAREVVTHDLDGFLVNPANPGAMAELVFGLHHDRAKLAAMSLAALDRFQSYPTWEASASAIRMFLQDLVGHR
jgi:glycosyltransferase involved in cell wall biosynthesis